MDSSSQPTHYNAAEDLIGRNLKSGRGEKIAYIDEAGSYTYSTLAERVDRCANALLREGIRRGDRIILCLLDTIDFPACFLGAIKAGIVPIPINTLFQAADYAYILRDSGPKALVVSESLLPRIVEAIEISDWRGRIIVSGTNAAEYLLLSDLMAGSSGAAQTASTRADDTCFLLYSSGSTGEPKGAVHRQASLVRTAELFGRGVLGLEENDVVYSAAKLFFAYGLGNALSFTLAAGATAILHSARAHPKAVCEILRKNKPTIFCGVPTLFSSLLVCEELPLREELNLRLCTSAGEALPGEIGRSWTARTGVEIIDGIGSTEMLHIFISNCPGSCRYGTTGKPVPGYKVRVVDESGRDVAPGEMGDLHVSGPSAAVCYWNKPEKTKNTFLGEWVKTGDRFRQDTNGDYVYCGRSDEMLKVGGLWVSPMEVESALISHEAVLEAAVVGALDENELVKPKAFVVVKPGVAQGSELAGQLKDFVKNRLAPYKYPRWIEFVEELPKTATGKIRRNVLRAAAEEKSRSSRRA
ncbi:MAG TPA: benzoate-CoA ligase family protein [Candidatus Acidoferrum sp.]|jgi:benzoate-CoA ligase|nr:benzoate-CoA ligase family protein [Candidatus Acidoferrum sp.]